MTRRGPCRPGSGTGSPLCRGPPEPGARHLHQTHSSWSPARQACLLHCQTHLVEDPGSLSHLQQDSDPARPGGQSSGVLTGAASSPAEDADLTAVLAPWGSHGDCVGRRQDVSRTGGVFNPELQTSRAGSLQSLV